MTRSRIFIFIAVFIIIGTIVAVYYYSRTPNNGTPDSTDQGEYSLFNPLGGGTQNDTTGGGEVPAASGGNGTDASLVSTNSSSPFRKITEFAVAGGAFFEDQRAVPITEEERAAAEKAGKEPVQKFETVPSLRYVEKATGHIYQMYLDTKVEGKVSNSTIPSIYEAVFDATARTVVYRYLASDNKTIRSFIATLGQQQGEFLPDNITDISLSGDKTKFFYLAEGSSFVTGTTRAFSETKKTQVFSSSFTEWLSQWASNQKIYLTTKPAATVEGVIYSMNTSDGALTKILGGVKGLTTLANKDGSVILYSESGGLGPSLNVFDVKTHTSRSLSLYGLPEKCIWMNDNVNLYCAIPASITGSQYPDSWYQGLVSFTDRIIKINTSTLSTFTVADSSIYMPVDATRLFTNKAESLLFFTNKKDSTLWSLPIR
ncbi:MAG: hypothetical protein V4665_02410 [Patescibacteria group bacterium]